MEPAFATVGMREAKNRFSELTAEVNASGRPLVVYKNSRPWVTVQPADVASAERRQRLERFRSLTRRIDAGATEEPEWDATRSDRDLLNEERVRRFG